jgi:hypothetical protein
VAQRAFGLGRPHTKFEKLLRRELPGVQNFHLDTKRSTHKGFLVRDEDGIGVAILIRHILAARTTRC